MLTLEKVQEKLNKPGVNHAEIARLAGLTRSYINALSKGVRLNPTYNTIKNIAFALESLEID